MLRRVLFLLVFTAMADPVAKTLCPVWCDRASTFDAVACEHGMPATTSVDGTGEDSCCVPDVGTLPSIPEESTRLGLTGGTHVGIHTEHAPFVGAIAALRAVGAPSLPPIISAQRLSAILRI